MIFGDVDSLENHFKRYDERLLERICKILPDCITAVPDNPSEDEITRNLIDRFEHDNVIRKLFYRWEYQFEPFGRNKKKSAYSKGKIDFAVFWDQGRDKYLAYEAKRLNVKTTAMGTASLATQYVTEGLVRFIKGQYSEDLPVGCMLGYVLDGNVESVLPKIIKAITRNSKSVGLVAGPNALPAIASAVRMASEHQRKNSGRRIGIRHALVPCSR